MQRHGEKQTLKKQLGFHQYNVNHYTGWSILWMSGEFKTRLRVTEDWGSKTVRFELLDSAVMDEFDGLWTLRPYTQRGLDRLTGKLQAFRPFGALPGALSPHHPHFRAVPPRAMLTPRGPVPTPAVGRDDDRACSVRRPQSVTLTPRRPVPTPAAPVL